MAQLRQLAGWADACWRAGEVADHLRATMVGVAQMAQAPVLDQLEATLTSQIDLPLVFHRTNAPVSAVVAEALNSRYDPAGPLGQVWAVTGPLGATFVMSMHHSVTDGAGMLRLARHLLGEKFATPRPSAAKDDWAALATRALTDPRGLASDVAGLVAGAAELLKPTVTESGRPGRPGRGGSWSFGWTRLATSELASLAAGWQVSRSAALTGLLAAAFDKLPAASESPMVLNLPAVSQGSFTVDRIALNQASASEIARQVHAHQASGGNRVTALLPALAVGAPLVPAEVLRQSLERADLTVSLIPARVDSSRLGVSSWWAVASPIGAALSVTGLLDRSWVHLGMCADTAAINPAEFADAWTKELRAHGMGGELHRSLPPLASPTGQR